MSSPQSIVTAADQEPTPILPPLNFQNVPHWGWRAEAHGHRFEIERLEIGNNSNADRFEAFVRKSGTMSALERKGFHTTIAARAWLEIKYARIALDALAEQRRA